MAFWLAAALLNIFGRGPSGPGAVPENRTWTVFFYASSGGSSEAAAAAPGGLPTPRRAAGAAALAPSLAGGTHPAPSTAFRRLAKAPASRRASGTRNHTPEAFGTDGAVPGAAGTSLSQPRMGHSRCPPAGGRPLGGHRALRASPGGAGRRRSPELTSGSSPAGKHGFALPHPLPSRFFFFFFFSVTSRLKKKICSSLAKAFLLFPRQTAEWLGAAVSARFARCPGQPLIRSGSSSRKPSWGDGRGFGVTPLPAPSGTPAWAPCSREENPEDGSWSGNVLLSSLLHPQPRPVWLWGPHWGPHCLPDGVPAVPPFAKAPSMVFAARGRGEAGAASRGMLGVLPSASQGPAGGPARLH